MYLFLTVMILYTTKNNNDFFVLQRKEKFIVMSLQTRAESLAEGSDFYKVTQRIRGQTLKSN